MTQSILHFNGTWRIYQKRILDHLDEHLKDSKLHIVAAPGAGKTTLGIEVIARLNRPTLILCPTNTIKNQWRERICSSFLREQDYGIVTTDIRKPRYITVITYQALLAAFCGNDEPQQKGQAEEEEPAEKDTITASNRFRQEKADEIVAILKAAGISLLCFDEAHHLRKEWWKALIYLNEHLGPEQTLALTATPPYDADLSEWKRYQDLCGDIDEVISIPELVKNGDLCPHQDFICFSSPSRQEKELIERHRQNVRTYLDALYGHKDLLDALARMPFFNPQPSDVETILDKPEFYVSIAGLLKDRGYRIPSAFLGLFDASERTLPAFDTRQAETFLNGFFQAEGGFWTGWEEVQAHYLNQARRMGLMDGGKAVLDGNAKYARQIAGSVGKLDSIVRIVKEESALLGERLRMVILADFIRMGDTGCTSLGVVPIWRRLKDNFSDNIYLGVLCGSLILIPVRILDRWQQLLAGNDIPQGAVTMSRFAEEENYVRIVPKEAIKNHIVRLVTDLFNTGGLTVLVGTQALLGEGWDAPSINSLILSSTVSSYMLSNQMRGRAIRIDRNNPTKVSNIWHLATVDPQDTEGNYDLQQLSARFQGYEAPSYYDEHEIVSGIERVLGNTDIFPDFWMNRVQVTTWNLARQRDETRRWWEKALYRGYGCHDISVGVEVPEVTVSVLRYISPKYFIYAVLSLIPAIVQLPPPFVAAALVLMAVFLLVFVIRFLKTGTVGGVMRQIAIIVLERLHAQGLVKTPLKQVGLRVTDSRGQLFVRCANLPAQENNLFLQCMNEFLDPVENPRYLLIRRNRYKKIFRQKDYFAVPALLSPNKESAEAFRKMWEKQIGPCELVYTRNTEGRKMLLKARKDAFSARRRAKSKRLSKWQ